VIVNRVGLGAIARPEGPVETIVETIEAVVKAAPVAKGVPIGDLAVVVKVEDAPKAGPVAAADGLLKDSPKSS
jgi:hypothetical protein